VLQDVRSHRCRRRPPCHVLNHALWRSVEDALIHTPRMQVPRTHLVLATGAPPFLPPSFASNDSSLYPVTCCASHAKPRACVRRMPWCRGAWACGCVVGWGLFNESGQFRELDRSSLRKLNWFPGTAGVHPTPREQLLEQVLNREHPRTQGPDNGVTRSAKASCLSRGAEQRPEYQC
jgi:hypothetical protein